PGAVRADDRVPRATGDVEVHAHDDGRGPEALAHVGEADRGLAHARPAALISSITRSHAERKWRPSRHSTSPPATSRSAPMSHGRALVGSMVSPESLNDLPCAAPIVRNEHSSTSRTKPATATTPGATTRA